MNKFVILPHQLFDIQYLDKESYIYVLYEHPQYFTKYNFNKKKLILHHASMQYYYDYLKSKKFKVQYIHYNEKFDIKDYTLFDPIDKLELENNYTLLESPNFLLNKEIYENYRKKTKSFFFNAFYNYGKEQINVIPDIKSQDKFNREPINIEIEEQTFPSNSSDEKYIKKGIAYVNKHFDSNYGNTDNFIYPISHKNAKKFLKDFIKNKFENFGTYQDAIMKDRSYLYHSLLSSSLNIGLLNPSEIIEIIMPLKDKIPLNSFEGYIRQLFWREYQRYCYIYFNFRNKQYFNNTKNLTKDWYTGTLGIEPVDNAIKRAFDTAYLHHIERLMVLGNFMNLSGIKPIEGYKWFMEFSIDSYEWVMEQNVLDMVFFVSNGKTMRRPYASSSNYILKMSNYKKGPWADKWNKLYDDFIIRNKDKLYKYRYFFKNLKV